MTPLEREAHWYAGKGFSVIPVSAGKAPLVSWREFQERIATSDEITKWFATDKTHTITGIAIVTGKISNLVVLDVEVDGDTTGLEIPRTPMAKTGGGGWHYYFKHPGTPVKNLVRIGGRKMDLRGDGGYVVAPPSVSAKGPYTWELGLGLPLVPMPDWLSKAEHQKAEINTPQVGQPSEWERITQGVEEGVRHDTAVRLAGKLLHHLPLKDRGMVWPLLEGWNKQNRPPLEANELSQIYRDIRRRHESGETTQPTTMKRPLLSVGDLLAYTPATHAFLVDQLVPHRGITALGGQPGVGKSWVMLEIAKAIAKGEPLFGRFPTLQGNVLIIDEEGGMDEMSRRAKMLGFADDLPIHFHIVSGFKLDKEEDLSQLLTEIKEHNISLVILDPYIGMHNKSENSAEETALVMEALQKLVNTGTAVLYIHHLRKDSIAKFGLAQALRGSSVLLGRLDSLIVAKGINGAAATEIEIHHEKARRGSKVSPFTLALTETEGKMALGHAADVVPAKLKAEQAREAILDVLADGEEISRKDVLEIVKNAIGVGGKNTSEALRELVEWKFIVEVRHGREKCYTLAPKDVGSEVKDI